MLRITTKNPQHPADIRQIHANEIIPLVIICRGNLTCLMIFAPHAMLGLLPAGRRIDRITNLLPADRSRINHVSCQSTLPHKMLENHFCHGTAADIAVADKQYFFIFSKLQIRAVFLLKCPILQGFPAFGLSDANRASSQFFPYCFILVPARLVKTLVNCCSVPMGFFRLAPAGSFLPVHHQTAHGCKHSASH